MSNEIINLNNLVMALIEAQGFDVMQAEDYQPRSEPSGFCGHGRMINPGSHRDEDGNAISILKDPIIEYKLTKRSDFVPMNLTDAEIAALKRAFSDQ